MSLMEENSKLLPINASALEKALVRLSAYSLSESRLPILIDQLWAPVATDDELALESIEDVVCPEALLTWLAWSLSVDTWQDGWDVSRKREVIKESIPVHQHKGTLGAVKRVLAALNVSIKLTEWWEDGGSGVPYTFDLELLVNEEIDKDKPVLLDSSLYDELQKIVDMVKPVRSHYDFRVGTNFSVDLEISSGATAVAVVRNSGRLSIDDSEIGFSNQLTLSSGAHMTLVKRHLIEFIR